MKRKAAVAGGLPGLIGLILLLLSGREVSAQQTSQTSGNAELLPLLKSAVLTVDDREKHWPVLLDKAGSARFVLMGDATHGSSEFYRFRQEFGKRLIREKGFSVVVIEASWPDAYQLNRYLQSDSAVTAEQALEPFKKYPGWYWRNREFADWLKWLKDYNASSGRAPIYLYGLDLYDVNSAVQSLLSDTAKWQPALLKSLQKALECLQAFDNDGDKYGQALRANPLQTCEKAAVRQWALIESLPTEMRNPEARAVYFNMRMNALLVKAYEAYYRRLYLEEANIAWTVRERFMKEVVDAIDEYHRQGNDTPKMLLWAHNSHAGDASATAMAELNKLSIGQLLRKSYSPEQVFIVGQLTYQGQVRVTNAWGGRSFCKTLTAALPESHETLLHAVGLQHLLLLLPSGNAVLDRALSDARLQRFVGIFYNTEYEKEAHYFPARLAQQYDAVVFTDTTSAAQSLDDPC